jgi:hypothetical protein
MFSTRKNESIFKEDLLEVEEDAIRDFVVHEHWIFDWEKLCI